MLLVCLLLLSVREATGFGVFFGLTNRFFFSWLFYTNGRVEVGGIGFRPIKAKPGDGCPNSAGFRCSVFARAGKLGGGASNMVGARGSRLSCELGTNSVRVRVGGGAKLPLTMTSEVTRDFAEEDSCLA